MDDIPAPLFILAGIGIAAYSTFIALKTDFTRFVFFFIAAVGMIGWGVVKIIFAREQAKIAKTKKDPYAVPARPAPTVINQAPQAFAQQQYAQRPQQAYAPQYQQRQAHPRAPSRYGFYQAPQQVSNSRFHDAIRRQN